MLSFSWEALVPFFVHDVQVEVIEAMCWIGQPLSASDLKRILDREGELSHVVYHMGALVKVGAIALKRKRRVRGTIEKFYFLQ